MSVDTQVAIFMQGQKPDLQKAIDFLQEQFDGDLEDPDNFFAEMDWGEEVEFGIGFITQDTVYISFGWEFYSGEEFVKALRPLFPSLSIVIYIGYNQEDCYIDPPGSLYSYLEFPGASIDPDRAPDLYIGHFANKYNFSEKLVETVLEEPNLAYDDMDRLFNTTAILKKAGLITDLHQPDGAWGFASITFDGKKDELLRVETWAHSLGVFVPEEIVYRHINLTENAELPTLLFLSTQDGASKLSETLGALFPSVELKLVYTPGDQLVPLEPGANI